MSSYYLEIRNERNRKESNIKKRNKKEKNRDITPLSCIYLSIIVGLYITKTS